MVAPHINGLILFIAGVRECSNADSENARIIKEIAKIKQKLVNAKNLNGYERKKCCWKLVYCYLLGFDVDFGYLEVVQLLSSTKYSEKNTGYIASSLLFLNSTELLCLCVNTMKIDMSSPNENFVALALNNFTFVANEEMIENLLSTIIGLTKKQNENPYIHKKAYMCLLKILRKDPNFMDISVWKPILLEAFEKGNKVSVLIAVCNVILAYLELDSEGWEDIIPHVMSHLDRCANDLFPSSFVYYNVPAPWLQVKLLRMLQFLPPPSVMDSVVFINEVIRKLILRHPTQSIPNPANFSRRRNRQFLEAMNRFNIGHAILFEAINVGIHYENSLDLEIKEMVITKLGTLLTLKEPNVRYIGLDAMARMAYDPVAAGSLKRYTDQIISQLREGDISIKRQSLNLLYGLCDKENWSYIINELLNILKNADNVMQEELVLKIAILVEKNAPDLSWYVDVVFRMFEYAPDYVAEDVWYRVVQVVTGFDEDSAPKELQEYAAQKAFDYLSVEFVYEPVVKMGAYLLGEFGHQISKDVTGQEIFTILKKHITLSSPTTKGMIFVALSKLSNVFPELQEEVVQLLEEFEDTHDVDLQTRACELALLLQLGSENVEKALGMMPMYSEHVQSNNLLIARLKQSAKTRAQSRVELEDAAATAGGLLKTSLHATTAADDEEDDETSEKDEEEDDEDSNASTEKSDLLEQSDLDELGNGTNGVVHTQSNELSEVEISNAIQKLIESPGTNAIRLYWKILCLKNSGSLYESSVLRISLTQSYSNYKGSLAFTFSNHHSKGGILCPIRLNIAQQPNVTVELETNNIESLSPGESIIIRASVTCHSANMAIPSLDLLTYFKEGGSSQEIKLRFYLPVIVTKFCIPNKITSESTMGAWQSLGASNEEKCLGTLKFSPQKLSHLMEKIFNFSPFQVGEYYGASSVFVIAPSQPQMQPTRIPCLCMMKEKDDKSIILVRSMDKSLSKVVSSFFQNFLMVQKG
ncbi:adaptin n terminal region domain-containing protein [Cardiosporidium cionae]|uniref:AP-2 complex subunit alpha n=1 Tax=Cardiosporidium cionae TaxID=476202 RepID=A0ABQ7JBW0_9APIC|nr:adaptin n terminal region domain-containing protein [Cardiosporidium cionae]|eukprot:KAF8821456.1 adaptin n terminal region domain-containing protein [Cardiosporidium cionae]